MIVFEKCDPKKQKCKSEHQITEWLKNKYILTLTNTKSFIQHEFNDKRIAKRASLKWWALSEKQRIDQVRMISRTKINLNDYQWDIGNFLQENEEGFDVEIGISRELPYDNRFWFAITFEVSSAQLETTRTVYTVMDLLKDVGGLFTAIWKIFGVLEMILQYRGMYMHITSAMQLPDKY